MEIPVKKYTPGCLMFGIRDEIVDRRQITTGSMVDMYWDWSEKKGEEDSR